MSIRENLDLLKDKIDIAARKSGREPEEIILVVASKYADIDLMNEAIEAGVKIFGENRAQDFREKFNVIGHRVRWHFIGHLQRNKVKYIIGKVDLIHSVDSLRLASEINKRAKRLGIIQDILIEVNISGEEAKFGITEDINDELINKISGLDSIRIRGLMIMAPLNADKVSLENIFQSGKKLYESLELKKEQNFNISYLSMGMTNDFEIAIENGSNMIRIGSAIFKPYQEGGF